MNAIAYANLRRNLKNCMDKVFHDNAPLIITRQNNENVVLISIAEYNSLIETNYLMSGDANARHLAKSIAQHKSGNTVLRELHEDN